MITREMYRLLLKICACWEGIRMWVLTSDLIFHFLFFRAFTSNVLYHSCFLWDYIWEGCITATIVWWLLFSDKTEINVGNQHVPSDIDLTNTENECHMKVLVVSTHSLQIMAKILKNRKCFINLRNLKFNLGILIFFVYINNITAEHIIEMYAVTKI